MKTSNDDRLNTPEIQPGDDIRRTFQLFADPSGSIEVRAPKPLNGTGILVKHFTADQLESAVVEIVAADTAGKYRALYCTINPVNPLPGKSASDKDVVRRHRFYVDCDPVKPAGMTDSSATDAEHECCIDRARIIRDWLTAKGWPAPVVADSSNGGHLIYAIDLPNDEAAKGLIAGCLKSLKKQFSDGAVSVDTSVSNASRITKIYGTVSRKGEHTADRPHRRSRLLEIPDALMPVPADLLRELSGIETPEQGAIRRCVQLVRNAVDGGKHAALNNAAFTLGGYIASGVVREDLARDALREAIRLKPNVADLDAAYQTIEDGIAAGKSQPTTGNDWKPKASQPRARADQGGDEAGADNANLATFFQTDLGNSERLATVTVRAGEYPEATDAAELHLIAAEVGIFQRGCLVRISREQTATVRGITRPVGAALIAALGETYLRDLLDRLVEWQKWNDKAGDFKRCSVPPDIAKRLLSRDGMWNFPVLTGVVTAPTLRPDGSLIDAPGYDAATGLFLDFQGEHFPAIPDAPTMEQGKAALAFLVREILENRCIGDDANTGFAFASTAAKAAALSAILTALVRHTVPTAPLHLFSACRAGSGKSLLADAVSLIANGKTATILDLAEDNDEQEKRLLSVFLAGDSVINLDNVELPLGGSHLCKALTAETFTGRILGLSQNATVPTTATWLATGNNVIVKEDLTRRVVLCQLDPQTETPEKREFDRNLLEWIPANRPALAMAALTALRSYVVAGKPKQPIPPMGSFEDWHRLVRSALIWLGEADPLGDTNKMEDSDPTRFRLRALIYAWHNAFKTIPTTAKEAVARANSTIRDENGDEISRDSILRDALADHFTDGRRGGISTRYLGDFLSKIKGRIECGARFEQAGKAHSAQIWRVSILDPRRFEAEKG